MKVFVTGATGFVGRKLCSSLVGQGHSVVAVTRSAARGAEVLPNCDLVEGDPTFSGDWQQSLAGSDVVFNLAGEPIADGRWDSRRRQVIRDSRVDITRFVVEGMASLPPEERPSVLVSASGVDVYPFAADLSALGLDDDETFGEDSPPGDHFLARVCRDWESEADEARKLGTRVAVMRFGIVLGKNGGALARMLPPFKAGVGGKVGSGRQWFSWIHIDDAVAALLFAMDTVAASGPFNLVAPGVESNQSFSTQLASSLNRPCFAKVPAFALRLGLGGFSDYLLNGRCVVPEKLEALGFEFRFSRLSDALNEILN